MMNERDELVSRFREIQPKFSRIYASILAHVNLTLPQFVLLTHLVQHKTISMTEISAKLHISKPAVTNLVDRLEKHGFLKRLPHPNDRRVYLIGIQPKGDRVVRETQVHAFGILLKAFDQFNAKEQKVISQFYALLSSTMDNFLESFKRPAK
jgi:DNA-binding MarR family transcriptional regulator